MDIHVIRICFYLLATLMLFQRAHTTCTWPSVFQQTEWWDSRRGSLSFTSSEMSGFTINIVNSNTTDWECYDNSYFATERILILKSKQPFFYITDWRPYLCLELNPITASSYRYYQLSEEEINAGKERVYVTGDGEKPTKADICSSSGRATGREFSVLVRKGSEPSSKITCPQPLQGRFDFSFTNASGSLLCDGSTEVMDVCTDPSTLNVDPACPGQSFMYADAEVLCVASFAEATNTVVQLFNPQSNTDDTATYRFSCMVASSDSLTASIVYNNCTEHQTPTYAARRHDGVVIGSLISLTPLGFCKLPTTPAPSTTTPATLPTSRVTETTSPSTAPSTSTAQEGIAKTHVGSDDNTPTTVAVSVSVVLAVIVVAVVVVAIWMQRRKNIASEENKTTARPEETAKKFTNKPVSTSAASVTDVTDDVGAETTVTGNNSSSECSKTEAQASEEIEMQDTTTA